MQEAVGVVLEVTCLACPRPQVQGPPPRPHVSKVRQELRDLLFC